MQYKNLLDGNNVQIIPLYQYLIIKHKDGEIKLHINDLQINIQHAKMKQVIEIMSYSNYENKSN